MNKVPSLKFDWSKNKLLQLLKQNENGNDDSEEPLVPDEEADSVDERPNQANNGMNENPHEQVVQIDTKKQ